MSFKYLYLLFFLFIPYTLLSFDPCDRSLIYSSKEGEFCFCVHPDVMDRLYRGNYFGQTTTYTPEETERLYDDIRSLYNQVLFEKGCTEKVAVMTAGAPGAGKTTLMRRVLAQDPRNISYVCADDICLKGMDKTYLSELKQATDKLPQGRSLDKLIEVRQKLYNKWRPASNAALQTILAHLIRQNHGFYFGTTSSSPTTEKFFRFLKSKDYKIHLLHVTAPDDVRWKSIQERDKVFVQTTERDIKDKGMLVPQRITDSYLKFADRIDFYYRSGVHEKAVLAAI